MIYRILAAMALVCVMALPSQAKPQTALGFYIEQGVRKDSIEFKTVRATVAVSHKAGRVARKVKEYAASNALNIARKYIGTNPTKMRRLWCANFVGVIEKKAGRAGTGSNLAKSYAKYGQRVSLSQAKPGDIVVTTRKGGGHVGYLIAKLGSKVRLISGNSGGRKGARVVAEGNYPVSRIYAIVRPS